MKVRLTRDTIGGTNFKRQWTNIEVQGYGRVDLTQYMPGGSGSCVDVDDTKLIRCLLDHHLFIIQRVLNEGNPHIQFKLFDARLMTTHNRIESTFTELNDDYSCVAASGKYLLFAREVAS